jgi:hypothetical protein
MQFRDYPEPGFKPPATCPSNNPIPHANGYVMHCHNTVHEDHAMMMRFDIDASA